MKLKLDAIAEKAGQKVHAIIYSGYYGIVLKEDGYTVFGFGSLPEYEKKVKEYLEEE